MNARVRDILLSVTLVFLTTASHAGEADCAKVEISSGGNSCPDLRITADLSACDDSMRGSPEITCKKNHGKIIVRGKRAEYRFTLKRGEGAWGAGEWIVGDGQVVRREDRAEHSHRIAERHTAEAAPTKSTEPSTTKTEANSTGFQFAAYFDAYYMHNFNRPQPAAAINSTTAQGAMIPNAQNNLRFYDWYTNQVGLNLAEFTVKHSRKSTSFVLDLDFGQMADINAQVPTTATSGGPNSATVDEVSKHIGQAIFTYTPESVPGLVFDVGKMPTHVGLELIKARDNWNYSRGVLFSFGGPFWHTGVHVGYSFVPDQFTANIYLYQGWNTIYENNSAPTLGTQLKWIPVKNLTWLYNYIGGPEQARNNGNWKQVHETNVTFNATQTLGVALDFLSGSEKNVSVGGSNVASATWTGLALLAKWQAADRLSLSPRFEVYRDHHGYTLGGTAQTLRTYTLTASFQVAEGMETRLEYRYDDSTAGNRFFKSNGADTTSAQSSLALALLYSM